MKRWFLTGAALLLIVICVAALWMWNPREKEFHSKQTQNSVALQADNYTVEIIRDQYGVPHIFGPRDQDVSFGLGYAHAQDDFETIQEIVAATRGDLARYRGLSAAPTDYIVALLKVWETVDAGWEITIPNTVKEVANAYAHGVNLYAAQNPKAVWPGLTTLTGKDVVAGFVFRTPFFYGMDETLLALNANEYAQQIALDPGAARQSFVPAPRTMAKRGSNAIAVAPERSSDGHSRLFINSHQPLTGPVAWYEAHLVSEEGLDITGGTFPGAPIILHGFNTNLAWANTVNAPDLVDTYVLTVNPKNKNQYLLDGKWVEFEKTKVTLRIGVWGPFALRVKRDVFESAHGPVMKTKHGVYALRYAGQGEARQLEQYYRLNKATDMAEFLQAMAMNALPSINYVYADRAGNIGFIHNGQFPDRVEGWDWRHELPGDRSDLIWDGYLSFDKLPILINPESGVIWNANNTPFLATGAGDNLNPDDFSETMGLQDNNTNRALRLQELTGDGEPISRERLLEIKFDNRYSDRSIAAEVVKDLLDEDWSDEPRLSGALQHLSEWNFRTDIDNHQAALGVLTTIREVTFPLTHIPPPDRKTAFREAVDLLMENYGTIDVPWGEVSRLRRGDLDLPVSGAPDVLRAMYPKDVGEDAKLAAIAGDSWMALVSWDPNGVQRADVVHQFGSATLDSNSPHYADQMQLFVDEKFRSALLNKDDIIAGATQRYRPQDNN